MKSPTNYGSENEEMRFIRRVAAPDRLNKKRRQKKRLAVAGATIGLLAASAGVGYATMRASNASSDVKSAKLEASMANDMFVSKLGDAFHPSDFDQIDTDGDGELSKDEILADLNDKETADVKCVMTSDLPDDIKSNLVALLEAKPQSDSNCTGRELFARPPAVRREDHEIFYYMLDVFCPRVTIAVTPPRPASQAATPATSQQTVEILTPDGGTAQVLIVGDPEDGKQTIAIRNN
ncbi:putative storage protein LPV [Phytophthora cinnamomi]|uniref:putative storage protein LPV n=1 Tax=Phytophthora cinnamomi TaxID=4785 RepID=UPI003559482E|nr:putative storage protein LPV [Phytophthora cinnamomi]